MFNKLQFGSRLEVVAGSVDSRVKENTLAAFSLKNLLSCDITRASFLAQYAEDVSPPRL